MTSPRPSRKKKSGSESTRPNTPADYPNISGYWLLRAAAIVFLGALACAWITLCLLYWQGSWQLLYHPKTELTRTPASAGLAFEPVRFAVTETGIPRLTGWWMPDHDSRYTVLFLHGAEGNLSDSVDTLAALHQQGLAIFAFDYRGYGQSQPGRPNEKQLRQDAEWALTWLTVTRHDSAKRIIVYGSGLGATLAAELAAEHAELAGVVLDQPLQDAMAQVWSDPRSRLVPAHWLVQDRYDLTAASASLRVPSLWLLAKTDRSQATPAYQAVVAKKTAVWLNPPLIADQHFGEILRRWLDDL